MQYKKVIFPLCLIIIYVVSILIFLTYQTSNTYHELNNNGKITTVNKLALPLIEDNSRYIELQTKEWIKKRYNKEPCYAVLEKDKVVMSKWIQHFDIPSPKIHYNEYHDKFDIKVLENLVLAHKNKRFVIKISHLQSNFGIIIVPPYNETKSLDYLKDIYSNCQKRFDSCFVCNHDNSDAPTNKEIRDGKKESYYKLYQTIKPGIVIQEFFDSGNGFSKPYELKILALGNKILAVNRNIPIAMHDLAWNKSKYSKVFELVRKISSLLGSSLIRVDIFIRKNDNPYVPYLNEISLSPSTGMNQTWIFGEETLKQYKEDIKVAKHGSYPEIDKMISECPYRDSEIKHYYTDGDETKKDKFSF